MSEQETDSVKHHRKRRAKIKKEEAEIRQEAAIIHQGRLDAEDLANYKGPIRPGETREDLLNRIRAMRAEAEKPAEPPRPFLTERQRTQLELEQQAGREAVAKAEAEAEALRQQVAARKAEGEKNRA